ncbi:MAG: hypothetical protein K2Y29_16385 [Beijerinckiaceae bacterium]|nr:hypothetical protein [Beijerinckiaceae bacterium]
MMIKMIAGCTRILGKAQGYLGLPIRDETIDCLTNGPGTPAMITAWEPTPDEIEAIKRGGTIYLRILGRGHPPVMMWAEPPAETEHA